MLCQALCPTSSAGPRLRRWRWLLGRCLSARVSRGQAACPASSSAVSPYLPWGSLPSTSPRSPWLPAPSPSSLTPTLSSSCPGSLSPWRSWRKCTRLEPEGKSLGLRIDLHLSVFQYKSIKYIIYHHLHAFNHWKVSTPLNWRLGSLPTGS